MGLANLLSGRLFEAGSRFGESNLRNCFLALAASAICARAPLLPEYFNNRGQTQPNNISVKY